MSTPKVGARPRPVAPPGDEYLNVSEAAGILGVSSEYVRRLYRARKIAYYEKTKRSYWFLRSDVRKYEATRRVEVVPAAG